jgi:L-ascorbate metabolism protein UlaG (beta-lactamase superfamily)
MEKRGKKNMENVVVRNLGIAALEIKLGVSRLLIDAFNNINKAEEVKDGDILLFTHDDLDHFDIDHLPDMKGREIKIIGPPSIVKPILNSDKASLDQITTLYSGNNEEPVSIDFSDFKLTCFGTLHFNDGWKPIHNSYIIKHKQGSIYITGDSTLTKDLKEFIGKVDVVICNLVDEGYLTKREDPRFAIHHSLSYLLSIMSTFMPKKIIGIHLLDCDWTADAAEMKKLVTEYRFNEIVIPVANYEIITL